MSRYRSYFLTEILLFGSENSSYLLRLMVGRNMICLRDYQRFWREKLLLFMSLCQKGKKDCYKKLVEALSTAFGGDDMEKNIAMMSFRGRMRKPDEDIQVFAYNLEVLLRRAMPKIGEEDRGTLLKQQFVEGLQGNLKRELLQRPTLSYEETVAIAQQLDLAG